MKYIRTKDGKIFYGPIDKKGRYKCANIYGWKTIKPIWNNIEIVKQSDTIEELCDEFVMVDTESGYCGILPKDKEIKFDKVNMGNAYGRKFYGAIWDDKGLVYVAKINDKGELELI